MSCVRVYVEVCVNGGHDNLFWRQVDDGTFPSNCQQCQLRRQPTFPTHRSHNSATVNACSTHKEPFCWPSGLSLSDVKCIIWRGQRSTCQRQLTTKPVLRKYLCSVEKRVAHNFDGGLVARNLQRFDSSSGNVHGLVC